MTQFVVRQNIYHIQKTDNMSALRAYATNGCNGSATTEYLRRSQPTLAENGIDPDAPQANQYQ